MPHLLLHLHHIRFAQRAFPRPSRERARVRAQRKRRSVISLRARALIALCLFSLTGRIFAATTPDLDDRTRAIAAELRCVVCQNLSVADSPSEMAQQMKGIIREQLRAGKTPTEIKSYFVSKYGEWVLLAPTTKGFSLAVWVLPFVALFIGLGLGVWLLRRWSTKKTRLETKALDPALLARVRNEAGTDRPMEHDPEGSSQQSQLRQERARLYADLKELEFDFQAVMLSATAYGKLSQEIASNPERAPMQRASSPGSVRSR